MKLIYSLLSATAMAEYFTLEMRLCTDKNSSNGMAPEAVGKKGAFFIQLQGGEKQQVNLPYNVRNSDIMKTRMKGDLSKVDWISLDYIQRDILCLEMLRLKPVQTNSKGVQPVYNIIQDYDPWAWDVTTGEQSWQSQSNKKISYWTKDCVEDTRFLTKVCTKVRIA